MVYLWNVISLEAVISALVQYLLINEKKLYHCIIKDDSRINQMIFYVSLIHLRKGLLAFNCFSHDVADGSFEKINSNQIGTYFKEATTQIITEIVNIWNHKLFQRRQEIIIEVDSPIEKSW